MHPQTQPRFKPAIRLLALCGALTIAIAQADDPLLAPLAGSDGPTAGIAAQSARGVLRAVDQATLASELAGRIVEMPFKEGESFNKGDLLARFDCSSYQAQLAASQAAASAAQAELDQNRQLAAMKSVGKHAVELAAAHLAQARAESRVYRIQVGRCRVLAPFSGRVVNRHIQAYESVGQGSPLLDIVDNRHLEINLLVPSRWLTVLRPGQKFTFTPDETGVPLEAEVARLGARIDEGSQTLSLIGAILTRDQSLIAGMSGTARFPEAR